MPQSEYFRTRTLVQGGLRWLGRAGSQGMNVFQAHSHHYLHLRSEVSRDQRCCSRHRTAEGLGWRLECPMGRRWYNTVGPDRDGILVPQTQTMGRRKRRIWEPLAPVKSTN